MKNSIQLSGDLLDFSQPKVMGILNVTPDSFYNGGHLQSDFEVLKQVEKMLAEGSDILDIGAVSSKPNAVEVSEKEEWKRLESSLKAIKKNFPNAKISIDTFRQNIAKNAREEGASMINDISGGMLDDKMLEWIGETKIPYVLMHMPGNPRTMMKNCNYKNLIQEIILFFSERINILKSFGANDILIDPGFGFGKDIEQNYELLSKLELLNIFELPIMVGLSRKSMIYNVLRNKPQEALNGTTALHMIALQNGAKLLRVHDVKEAKECISLYNKLSQFST